MTLRVRSFKSDGAWCSASPRVSGGVPLASAHAATHALQPMQMLASYNNPTAALGTGIVSAWSAWGTMVMATAAGAPVLAILENSSRRVMATSILFLVESLLRRLFELLRMTAVDGDPCDAGLVAALETLRSHPGCSANRSGNGAYQCSAAHFDLTGSAVNG